MRKLLTTARGAVAKAKEERRKTRIGHRSLIEDLQRQLEEAQNS